MTDDRGRLPEWGQRCWDRVFNHPEIERVELIGDIVRVRLRSGIELEWPSQSLEPPPPREWGPS